MKAALAGGMSRIIEWSSQRANPLLIRAVRQYLRSRGFVTTGALLVSAALLACSLAAVEGSGGQSVGGALFVGLFWGWSLVMLIQLPLVAYQALTQERQHDTWDLLELTALKPARIVRGLLGCTLVLGIFMTSLLLPYMAMAWQLRGLDIFQGMMLVVLVLLATPLASTITLFTACLSRNKATRALIGLMTYAGLGLLWVLAGQAATHADFWMPGILQQMSRDDDVWYALLAFAHGLGMGAWLLATLAVAMLTHRAENRSTWPRAVWLLTTISLVGWIIGVWWSEGFRDAPMIMALLANIWVWAAAILAIFATTEDLSLTPRQARSLTGNPFKRFFQTMLGPGCARGCTLVSLLLAASVGCAWWAIDNAHTVASDWRRQEALAIARASIAQASWVCILGALTIGLSSLWESRRYVQPIQRRMLFLASAAIMSLVPMMAYGVIAGRLDDNSNWIWLSPAWGIGLLYDSRQLDDHMQPGFYALATVGFGCFLLLVRTALHRGVEVRQVRALAADRNPRE